MRIAILVGLAAAGLAGFACSSKNTNALTGSETGGDAGGSCAIPMGTTANDGEGYVTTRGCQGCHGSDMSGTTSPLAANQVTGTIPTGVYLYPPNLTPDPKTGIAASTSDQIRYAIIYGVDNEGMNLCPEMKHYGTMCEDEALGIIAYLRSIPAVTKSIPGSICPPLKSGTPPSGG